MSSLDKTGCQLAPREDLYGDLRPELSEYPENENSKE